MLVCTQLQTTGDDCCIEEVCNEPAVWRHEDSGLGMCAVHERNAQQWSHATPGEWRVGATTVSYPEGWVNLEDGSSPVPMTRQTRSSGLILGGS